MALSWEIDPIALYAALLSSIIAIIQLLRWWFDGPRVAVTVINPREVRRFNGQLFELIISNVAASPTVVREVTISLHREKPGPSIKDARFYSGAGWDPAIKAVPHPTKEHTTTCETNLIPPATEYHQLLKPFDDYDPHRHWLKATVMLRNSRKRFVGWAGPVLEIRHG
ncbi:MAG TPA: hypothetical protein VNQ78_06105 [Paracoccus sp. (in: a-proteobacteria)]|uniref:hypothetical protein n=1 Tax=Paracoccus sp. TaxID=267 RepID=UPI002BDD677F|nr:hypothetical protein [Paracoccus sp. (in: a-proteobacteria)]HWL56235.1 hypothetical protein [Paracoccus sp. (in: a-proteobacteria)]